MQFIRERFPNFPDKVLLIISPKLYAFTGRMVSTEVKKKTATATWSSLHEIAWNYGEGTFGNNWAQMNSLLQRMILNKILQ